MQRGNDFRRSTALGGVKDPDARLAWAGAAIRSRLRFLILLGACLAPGAPLVAQDDPEVRYRLALDAVLADVADPERSFHFAEIATESGDLRGAVAALERILLINPTLSNVRLELGILYLRLGNPELGRFHIAEALKAPNVPRGVRARAETYLREAVALTQRNFFSGSVTSGFRYQSNANAGPGSADVLILDPFTLSSVPGRLSKDALESKDGSFEVALTLGHTYAIRQDGSVAWDSRLWAAGTRYDELTQLNQLTAQIETGPFYAWMAERGTQWSMRLFGAAGMNRLDGEDYIESTGGGAELLRLAGNSSTTRLRVDYTDRDFQDQFDSLGDIELRVSDRSGDYLNMMLSQYWNIGRTQWGLFLVTDSADAKADYQSYDRFGGGGSLRYFFAGADSRFNWSLFANAQYRKSDYDAPDVLTNPNLARKDKRFDAMAGVEIGFTREVSMILAAGYADNDSNIANYRYDDVSGSVMFTWRY
jgi:tetratricopeptide (TPR) repeat protein